MTYDVLKLPPRIIIGKEGENKYQSISIDVSKWAITGATFSVVYQRADGTCYPVTVTKTDDVLTWTPTATDLVKGYGKLEVRMYKGDMIAKSTVTATYCTASIVAGDEPSEEAPDWVQEIIDAYEQISPATTDTLGLVKVDGSTVTVDADGTLHSVGGGGGGGTTDYSALTNKPKINNVTLSGNKSLADLGINNLSTSDVDTEVATYWNAHKAELKGDKGDKGDTGSQGAKGDKGDKGDTGATYTITSADYDEIATVVYDMLTNAEEQEV